ncbi:TetR/AcrR family transcriptional regulator [Actinokineospora pegani]|uniref:TetR/AcrR family transcriptional regulator n=1 Tax=Actinokineospora pegani TaxID=2654637 RepID=UPI0012EA3EE5|nr:TetR/AcrR family transcriptional regulator [Actinokineospora pegani]
MTSREYPALPRGRHRLSREDVRLAQRDKLLLGMADAVSEKGYAKTTVADVLRRAHVSRETFYQQFSDKEDCFLATLDRCADLVLSMVVSAVAPLADVPTLDRFTRALNRYLAALVDQWPVTRTFFLECYAAGPVARKRRFAAQDRFAQAVHAGFSPDPAWRALPDPEFAARFLAAGLSSLVAGAVSADEPERLADLHAPVTDLVRHLLR